MIIRFYIISFFKQIRITKYTDFVEATIESGRRRRGGGGKKSFGEKRTIRQVSETVARIEPLDIGFHFGLLQRDKSCLQCLFHFFHFFFKSQTNFIVFLYFNELRLACLSECQFYKK